MLKEKRLIERKCDAQVKQGKCKFKVGDLIIRDMGVKALNEYDDMQEFAPPNIICVVEAGCVAPAGDAKPYDMKARTIDGMAELWLHSECFRIYEPAMSDAEFMKFIGVGNMDR